MDNPPSTPLQKKGSRFNKGYFTVGKWMAFIAMLYLAFRFVNVDDVLASFTHVSLLTITIFFIMAFISRVVYCLRGYLICRYGLGLDNISSVFLLRINLLSEFAVIATPSSLGGEAVRVLKLNARTRDTIRSTTAIMLDRMVGLISMGLINFIPLLILGKSIGDRLPFSSGALLITIVLLLSVLGIVFYWLRRAKWIPLPHILEQLNLNLSLLISLVLLSGCGHLIFTGGFYFLFHEVHPLSYLTVTALVLTSQLARSVPISFLGIGLSEGSLVALAGLVGIKPEAAMIVVVIYLGSRYVFALCGLLIELSIDRKMFLNTLAARVNADQHIS